MVKKIPSMLVAKINKYKEKMFYDLKDMNDEDYEDSINIKPSSIIRLEDDTNSEINIFDLKDNESTNEESVILNEKLELGKGQMEKCPSAEKK